MVASGISRYIGNLKRVIRYKLFMWRQRWSFKLRVWRAKLSLKLKRLYHRHHFLPAELIIYNELSIEQKYYCPACGKRKAAVLRPYDWFNSDRPQNLWEAIHWHKIEIVAFAFERLRLKQVGNYGLADLIRQRMITFGYMPHDFPECCVVTEIERRDRPKRNVAFNAEELIEKCLNAEWQMAEV